MNTKKSTGSAIRYLIFFGFLILIGFLPGCQTKKVETRSETIVDPYGRSEAWNFIGSGGGGAMFNPAVSPHNLKMAFVSCDMTGSFVTYNGGESWRMFNLRSPVKFYAFDPLDSNVVYANSIALFKSADKGITWKLFYPAPSEINGYVSKGDHGEEVLITRDSSSREVLALTIDPADSKKLYAAITINHSTGLYISEDGGEQWNQEKELEGNIKKIFIDPSSPIDNRTIYVAGDQGITQKVNGIWRNNRGPEEVTSLTEFSGGFDKTQQKYFIYSISGKSYFNPKGDKSGIYITDNGGMTWINRQDGLLSYSIKGVDVPEWRTVATSAFNPAVVYVSYNGMKIHKDTTFIGVAKSEDYGITWKLVWKDVLTKTWQTPSVNFSKDMLNDRWGPSWAENPFGLAVSPTNPEICFATDFGRTVKTCNGGNTWEQVYSKSINDEGWTSRGLEVTTGYNVVFDPFDPNHVFIALTDIGLFESKDGTVSWMSATKDNGIPEDWVNTCYWLQYDPEIKGKAWAVMSEIHDLPRPKMWRRNGISGFKGGVVITENNGKTWQSSSSDIGEAAMTHILVDQGSSKKARTLYACAFGKGVYKSADGGKTWIQKNKGIENKEPFAWQIVQREKDDGLFLIISRRSEDGSIGNEKDGAVYKSVDGAENWIKLSLPEGPMHPPVL
jgi:hypothetical protein